MSRTPQALNQLAQHSLIDAFIGSLDPAVPKHCVEYYIASIQLLESSLPALRVTRPDLYATALRFLTHTRDSDELKRLEVAISACQCPLKDHTSNALHGLDGIQGQSLTEFFNRICSMLSSCFNPIPQFPEVPLDTNRKRAKRARKEGRRAPWPEQPSDLFVYPPAQMLAMLWYLFRVTHSTRIISFLQVITGAAGSTFTSLFHTLPSFPQEYVVEFGRAFVTSEDSGFLTLRALIVLLSVICVRVGNHNSVTVHSAVWYPHAHELLGLFSMAITIFCDQPNKEAFNDIVRALSILGGSFILLFSGTGEFDPSHYVPQIQREAETLCSQNLDVDPFVLAWGRICDFVHSDECQAPGCTETFSKQNRRFAACSGCGIMSYCSKPCQVIAWKYPKSPHKQLCLALRVYTQKFAGQSMIWQKHPDLDRESVISLAKEMDVTRDEAAAVAQQASLFNVVVRNDKLNQLPDELKGNLIGLVGAEVD